MLGTVDITDSLVEGAANGRSECISDLVTRLEPKVRMMIAARLSPTPSQLASIDDLTQEVLGGLASAIRRLRHQTAGGLSSFLSTIIHRRVADFIRAQKRIDQSPKRTVSLDSTVVHLSGARPLWAFLSNGAASPHSNAARVEQLEQLLNALGALKIEHRDVITLAFFDQLPTAEIAQRLNTTRPAASMLLIRAVKALRRRLTGSSQLGDAREQTS